MLISAPTLASPPSPRVDCRTTAAAADSCRDPSGGSCCGAASPSCRSCPGGAAAAASVGSQSPAGSCSAPTASWMKIVHRIFLIGFITPTRSKSSMLSMNPVEENGMRGVIRQKSYDKFMLVEFFLFLLSQHKDEVRRKNRKKASCHENYWIPFRAFKRQKCLQFSWDDPFTVLTHLSQMARVSVLTPWPGKHSPL